MTAVNQELPTSPPSQKEFVHVDEFIEDLFLCPKFDSRKADQENYARFFFHLHRFPAVAQTALHEVLKEYKLFAEYNNQWYRATGCSRLGDIWLAKDFSQQNGYDHRVNVAEITAWSRNDPNAQSSPGIDNVCIPL